ALRSRNEWRSGLPRIFGARAPDGAKTHGPGGGQPRRTAYVSFTHTPTRPHSDEPLLVGNREPRTRLQRLLSECRAPGAVANADRPTASVSGSRRIPCIRGATADVQAKDQPGGFSLAGKEPFGCTLTNTELFDTSWQMAHTQHVWGQSSDAYAVARN